MEQDCQVTHSVHSARIPRRIIDMERAWIKNIGEDLQVIFPRKVVEKATYISLSNLRTSMKHVLEIHREATADRWHTVPFFLLGKHKQIHCKNPAQAPVTALTRVRGLLEIRKATTFSIGKTATPTLLITHFCHNVRNWK